MVRVTGRYVLASLACGAAWGLIAWLLWPERATAHEPTVAVVMSPLIGLLIGVCFVWIHRLEKAGRVFVALLSLYVAAALFGMCVGIGEWAERRHLGPSVIASAAVIENMIGTLWGLTFMFYFVVMWPLAYFNHQWLGRLARRT
jgi:hypothetical protein